VHLVGFTIEMYYNARSYKRHNYCSPPPPPPPPSYTQKMRVSLHASFSKFTGHSRIMGPQYGILCRTSGAWNLEVAPRFFGKMWTSDLRHFVSPYYEFAHCC
jgi:cytochrome b561